MDSREGAQNFAEESLDFHSLGDTRGSEWPLHGAYEVVEPAQPTIEAIRTSSRGSRRYLFANDTLFVDGAIGERSVGAETSNSEPPCAKSKTHARFP